MPAETTSDERMRATLVRFGPDLHAQLKQEAARENVSVAEYVRTAVTAHISATRRRRVR